MAGLAVLVAGVLVAQRALTTSQAEAAPAAAAAAPKAVEPASTSSAAVAPVAAAAETNADAEQAARDASWRESREAAIRVQQRLRAEQLARKSAQQEQAKSQRCVGGQLIKRVGNGWVQAGNC